MTPISGVDRPIRTFDHRGGANRFTLWAMDRRAPADRGKASDSARADLEALRSALAASEARASATEAKVTDAHAQIAALKLMIEKLRRTLYGRRSERSERLLGQLELELDELTANASEDDLTAERAPGRTTEVKAFERRRPSHTSMPSLAGRIMATGSHIRAPWHRPCPRRARAHRRRRWAGAHETPPRQG